MTVEYRDEMPFTNDLHTLQQIADALRHKKFGKDVREAIAQAVEKLYGIGPSTVISGSPAGAYATLAELQSAYPNGQQGVFVVAETGKWYIWNPRENRWDEGGNFQSPMSQNEISDGRIWSDGTVSPKIGDAIRGQVAQEKTGRVQADLQEKTERQEADRALNERIDLRDTALEVKNVRLKDNNGSLLWDGGNYVTGGVYLPKTDMTGLEEGLPVDSSIIGYTFLGHLEEYGLPILKLESPDLLSLRTKADGKLSGVKFDYNPNGFEGRTTHEIGTLKSIKVQGSSSQGYPKKNYTLNFTKNLQLKDTWGNHDKYVIKADWVDFSHMRNEFGAWLWGQIRKTNLLTTRDKLVDDSGNSFSKGDGYLVGETNPSFLGPNFGAIDSYPILVIVNNVYHGLYSMCVPKDDWMANLGLNEHDAILSCEFNNDFGQLAKTDEKGNLSDDKWGIEFISDEDNQKWLADDLNQLLDKIVNPTDSPLDDINQYMDIQSAIDYYVFNTLIANEDAITHNWLLQKTNGGKWRMVAYDMDSSLGMWWNGQEYQRADSTGIKHQADLNALFGLIYKYGADRLKERWLDLRQYIISDITLNKAVDDWALKVPKPILDYEAKRWINRPGTRTSNNQQIQDWLRLRTAYLDQEFNKL